MNQSHRLILYGVLAAAAVLSASGVATAAWEHNLLEAGLWLMMALMLAAASLVVRSALRGGAEQRAELVQLTAELRRAMEAAEAAKRSQGQFLANMSHELRTPFQGVLGMLQLVEQTPLNPLQRDLLHTAQESARHLLALLNDILDISAVEAGRLSLQEAPVQLRRLAADVQQLMRVQAAERGLQLSVELAPGLPAWVLGDATRIKQILFNLVGNALKFTQRGEVRLRIGPQPGRDGQMLLRMDVADTGIGMDAGTLSRLFQRFELGDPTISRRAGGAGLGLEISRTLARMMGGDITVTSQPGKGSTFTVTLDLATCDPPELREPTQAVVVQPVPPKPAARPLHVVLADDNAVNRKFLTALLQRLGHEVTACANGQEAVDQVRRLDADLVLMDLHMPILDGLGATRAIRQLPGADGTIAIIGLTADTLERTREAALEAGMDRLLIKPIDAAQLEGVLAGIEPQARWATRTGTWSNTTTDTLRGPDTAPMSLPGPLSTRFTELGEQLPENELPGLLDMFFDDRTRTIATLDEALARADAHQMAEAAHALKGSARLLGFRRLAHVAEAIERCVDKNRLKDAPALRRQLHEALAATRSAVGDTGSHGHSI